MALPPVVQQLLANILLSLIGRLQSVVQAFIVQVEKEAADDPTVAETIDKIVRQVNDQHSGKSWSEKFIIASETAMSYFTEIGKDISRALVNTLLSAKVIEVRQEVQPTDEQKTVGEEKPS